MSNIIKKVVLSEKEQKLTNFLNVEYLPDLSMESYDLDKKLSFPLENLTSLGVAIKPLMELVNSAKTTSGGSGWYYVETQGMNMFKTLADNKFIGSLKNYKRAVGGGQARMTPIPVNPLSITMAIAIMTIENKINIIIEDQKAIMAFMELKEEARIKSNANSLLEILNNYKYNINSVQYKSISHGLVKTIKKESDESVLLFDRLLNKKAPTIRSFHFDKSVDEEIADTVGKLNNYQLALYGFAFSSFLEILLLDNFNHDFIKSILGKISEYQDRYSITLQSIEQKIFQASSSSVESNVIKGISKINSSLGKLANKTPLLDKTELHKNLIQKSEKLNKLNDEKNSSRVRILSSTRKNLIEPFIENIMALDLVFNDSYALIFNQNKIYIDLQLRK